MVSLKSIIYYFKLLSQNKIKFIIKENDRILYIPSRRLSDETSLYIAFELAKKFNQY